MIAKTSLAIIALGAASVSVTAWGQDAAEVRELTRVGYANIGQGVWQYVDSEGVTHRVGFGVESESIALARLEEIKHEIELKSAPSHEDVTALSTISSAVVAIQNNLRDHAIAKQPMETKASGTFNSCTSGTNTPTTSVTPAIRTSNASVGINGFGPNVSGLIRLVFSYVQSASGAFTQDIDVAATYGGTFGPATSVSSSIGDTGACRLYAYAHSFNVMSGCGRWQDSYYNGPCN